MQHPTLTNIRIRSTQDAHRIFYAVQQGRLERVKRRLDAEERSYLHSGCVYVWEERGSHTVDVTGLGIERFTEGKRWTASRVREEFLFYYQLKPSDASPDWDQLIKQTYSVWVDTKNGKRKWHLTAYFSEKTVNNLQCIDDMPLMRQIMPPPGLYQSRKLAKSRSQPKGRSNTSKRTTVDRTYAPFHSQALSEPVAMHNPYNSVASQPLPQPIPGPSNSPTLPSPRTSLHSHNVNTAPPFTYPGVHTINDTLTSRSPATPSMTPVYANPTWSPAPLNYSAPAPIIVSPQMRGTISLPPVNAMYDEQQLFPLRDSLGPSFSQPVYNHAQPMGSVAPVEPWYDYSPSQDDNDSDVSKESHGSGLALAPMHDLEKRRFVYRRDSLDDRALRSLL